MTSVALYLKFLLYLLITGNCWAVEIQQTLSPKGGQKEFTVSLLNGSGNLEGSITGATVIVNSSTSAAQGSFAYGISDTFSISADTGYGEGRTNTQVTTLPSTINRSSATYRGLLDLNLKARGLFESGAVSIFVVAGYRHPWEKSFFNNDTDYGNRASRAPALNLAAVLMLDVGSVILGLESDYRHALGGKYESVSSGVTTNFTTTGGGLHTVSLIAEFQTFAKPNISLVSIKNFSQDITSSSGAVSYSEGYVSHGILIGLRGYQSDTFLFEGNLGYLKLAQSQLAGINVSKYEELVLGLGARFYF